ncbi:MAG: hypothetical protein HQK67_01875 [Desulfamplus sp.]|nr:hypothetical protein [Desulfamplus sp.]
MNKKRITMMFVMVLFAFVTLASNASAVITRSENGVGDALLFPFFDADALNYVCISNEANNWVQVHVRLRTAGDSIEGKDFPLILSPGDMAIFEVSRIGQADGLWRIDYSMDPNNFKYVRINSAPVKSLVDIGTMKNDYATLASSEILADAARTEANKRYGYIEVIGEAIFDQGLNKAALLTPGGCTNTARYIAAPSTNTLSDVPNVLSGKLYVMEGKYGTGMAYNAIAFDNFRTDGAVHRVDNYLRDTGVIVSSENSTLNDQVDVNGDNYTYMYSADLARATDGGKYEALVSANNTWGPTFADGDDYLNDQLDVRFGISSSVREFEAALRHVSVRGHYFNAKGFQTNLVLTLPTKHHVIVDPALLTGINSFEQYKIAYYRVMKALAPAYTAELWDTDENLIIGSSPFDVSPYVPGVLAPNVLPNELNILTPNYPYAAGRFVLAAFSDGSNARYLVDQIATLPVVGLSFINMDGQLGYMTETQY